MFSGAAFRTFTASIFVFLIVGLVSAQGIGDRNRPQGLGNYRITGKVVLPDGTPAKDVVINFTGTESPAATYRTNEAGEFEIPGLSNGNYNVSVRLNGYRPESESVNINGGGAGQSFPVVFYLKLAASANPLMKNVPKDAVSKYEKGMDKATKDDWKGAIADFDAAIAAYPNFAAAYYEKGAAQLKTNDWDGALESFVKAIQLKPDYVEAKYGYGYAEFEKKNWEVASAAFNDVLQQKKDMADAHQNLGISLFNLKNIDGAETELKAALSSSGGDKLALPHLYLGLIYSQKKQNADAIREYQKYLDMVPKAPNADRIKQTIEQLKKG
jgi:tetratricopeptide (TPR) repeat protein